MKLVVLLATLLFVGDASDTVFICQSKTAEVYHHSKECRGLKQCTHGVKPVRLEEAKAMGRRICGFED